MTAGDGGLDHPDERALLLLLADRQTYEPLVVRRCLAGPPSLREALAVALGRTADPRGLDPLLGLLLDDEPEVRRSAAFALGELGSRLDAGRLSERRRAAGALLDAVAGPDREVGTLAVEALGKLGVTVEQVLPRLDDLDDPEGGSAGLGSCRRSIASRTRRLRRSPCAAWSSRTRFWSSGPPSP